MMYELLYTWSDGELSNDRADDFAGVVESLKREQEAIEKGEAEYTNGAIVTELIVRWLP